MNGEIKTQYNNRARIEAPEVLRQRPKDAASYRTDALDARRAELNLSHGSGESHVTDMF